MARLIRLLFVAAILSSTTTLLLANAHGNDRMSHAFVAESIPAAQVILVPSTTEGPYYETEADYADSTSMTSMAKAGSPGVATDRASVLNGIPLNITINSYGVADGVASELVGAQVFVWQCDALGRYSAVPVSEQRTEGTVGQMWLRAKQTTGATGSITFSTILPGWYTGRVIHFHVRVRVAGSSSFAATTQFFIGDDFVNSYKGLAPYASNTQNTITALASDNVYSSISSSAVRDALVLSPQGSASSGYAATFNLGIAQSAAAATTTTPPAQLTTTAAVVATPPDTTSGAVTTTMAPSPTRSSSSSSSTSVRLIFFLAATAFFFAFSLAF